MTSRIVTHQREGVTFDIGGFVDDGCSVGGRRRRDQLALSDVVGGEFLFLDGAEIARRLRHRRTVGTLLTINCRN